MSKRKVLIEVGFDLSYGDGDFGVVAEVADLPPERMTELRESLLAAYFCAEDMWRRAREKENLARMACEPPK